MALVTTSDSCLLEKCRKSVSRVSTSVLLTMLLFFPSTVHCLGRPQLSRVFAVAMWENDRSLKFRSVTPWSKRRWKVDGHNSIGSRSYACSSFDTTNVYLMLESTSNAWILSVWVEASIQCMPWLYTKMMTWSGRHLSRTARQPPTTVPHPKKWVVTDFWYVPQLSKEVFEFTAQPIVSSLQTIQTLTLAGQCEHKGPAEGCADWPQLDLHLWYLEKKRHPRILHKLPSKGLDLIYKQMRRLHHLSPEFWTSAMAPSEYLQNCPNTRFAVQRSFRVQKVYLKHQNCRYMFSSTKHLPEMWPKWILKPSIWQAEKSRQRCRVEWFQLKVVCEHGFCSIRSKCRLPREHCRGPIASGCIQHMENQRVQ